MALKKRASANSAERAVWAADDLLFVSNYGEGDERQISFAHFSRALDSHDLPTLKVLGWDNLDTALHLDAVAQELTEHLSWPDDDTDAEAWRTRWRDAFTLRHREVVTTSKQLSIRLAELARNIRDRIKTALLIESDKGPLTKLMKAFQEALVHDLDADGFADMYAQTIAYGLLSARIADPHKKTADDFAAHMRTNPFLRELMETFLKVGGRRGKAGGSGIDFDELGVSEVVDLLDDANMEAVVRDFGDRNPQEDPVIHFYELFLQEYDAKKRMQRGVFYTPRPVVSYIVRSVDELLRTEFGLAGGLADTTTWGQMAECHQDLKIPEGVSADQDFVQILDPATGTGTFLVEVIDLIHRTLVAKWKAQGHGEKKIDALWNEYVPKHLLTRLHGYELLMAPYAIAHLKFGLKLYETGYRFGSDERARVYLTNALEPASDSKKQMEFLEWIPALAHEAASVNEIKQDKRFTVVLGNPPYSLYSSNLSDDARKLVEPYRSVQGQRIRERGALQLEKNLQDDYVKFFAFAENLLSASATGVLSLISNSGYLGNRSLRGMREHLYRHFRRIHVVDLHGSVSRARRDSPKDENVFDIVQGVSICLLADTSYKKPSQTISYLEVTGLRSRKYEWLLDYSIKSAEWKELSPAPEEFFFLPFDSGLREEFLRWPSLHEIMPINSSGMVTARDAITISFDDDSLRRFLVRFSALTPEVARTEYQIGPDTKDWSVQRAQQDVRSRELDTSTARVLYRPFDWRVTFYSGQARGFLCNPRRPVLQHMAGGGNIAIIVNRQVNNDFKHVLVSRALIDTCTLSSATRETAYVFPLFVSDAGSGSAASLFDAQMRPNISGELLERGREHVADLDVDAKNPAPAIVALNYVYGILHSGAYRSRYADLLRLDFPRIPLPGSRQLFRDISALGGELTALHLLESPKLEKPIKEFIGGRNPEVEKVSWSKNTVWIDKAQTTGFRGVREDVWNFHIGGYQVCAKWLKDRQEKGGKNPRPGRKLTDVDIAHYQKIIVALAETIRLMKEIDEVIEQHGGWPGAFQTSDAKPATAKVIPFRARTVEPKPDERYVTCVPFVPLKAAASAFGDPQHIEEDGFEWAAVESRHRLRPGMFVAQVVGRSMEPAIPDGAWCLFRAPVEGTRQGKTVLVQLRDTTDPETGQRYTIKRYQSKKAGKGDSWRHEQITLKPLNPDFEPIVLTSADAGNLQVIAELVEVLGA